MKHLNFKKVAYFQVCIAHFPNGKLGSIIIIPTPSPQKKTSHGTRKYLAVAKNDIPIVGKHHLWVHPRLTLPETNCSPLKIGLSPQKGHFIFQTSIFTCELLVSGRVKIFKRNATWSQTIGYDEGWMKQIPQNKQTKTSEN